MFPLLPHLSCVTPFQNQYSIVHLKPISHGMYVLYGLGTVWHHTRPRGGDCRRNMGLWVSSSALFRFHGLGPPPAWLVARNPSRFTVYKPSVSSKSVFEVLYREAHGWQQNS